MIVVGAGIVGLATARALVRAHPDRSVVVVEKEAAVGAHQSGRNSGVIHAGVYYQPGSAKARLCTAGRISMVAYCAEHGIDHEVCGKVVVALDHDDRARLAELERRCAANGVRTEMIGRERLRELEPHVAGVAALHVLDTGIVDYSTVCRALAAEIESLGASIRLESEVLSGVASSSGLVVETSGGPIEGRRAVTCAGLHADEVARSISGPDAVSDIRVVAFRGEYHELVPSRAHLVRGLVYPVPDPQFPFLGVHFTRLARGGIEAGPNAVLGFAREGYSYSDINLRDLAEFLTFPGLWRFMWKYRKMCAFEFHQSLSRAKFCRTLQRLVPDLRSEDLETGGSGVRAQAMKPDGSLVEDFNFVRAENALHVLNAPSPAATSSLAIGEHIVGML